LYAQHSIELLDDYHKDCRKPAGRIVPYIYTIPLSKQLLSNLSKLVNKTDEKGLNKLLSTTIEAVTPTGPTVVEAFSENPPVVWGLFDSRCLLYHIGCIQNTLLGGCQSFNIKCGPGNNLQGCSGVTIRDSADLINGSVDTVYGAWHASLANPSAFPNVYFNHNDLPSPGLVAVRGQSLIGGGQPQIDLASIEPGAHFRGPYYTYPQSIFNTATFSSPASDPSCSETRAEIGIQYAHAFHGYQSWRRLLWRINVGRYAFSTVGTALGSVNTDTVAYTTTASFMDGASTAYWLRERPYLLF
jgi:hypothetical protein